MIVATFVSLLAYVIDTSVLLLVGAVVIPNEISPTSPYVAELRTVNVDDDSVGVARATVSVVVIVPVAYSAVDACVAVIVVVPAPIIVIFLLLPPPVIIATLVLLLVYVNAPVVLFELGSVKLNAASPYVLDIPDA